MIYTQEQRLNFLRLFTKMFFTMCRLDAPTELRGLITQAMDDPDFSTRKRAASSAIATLLAGKDEFCKRFVIQYSGFGYTFIGTPDEELDLFSMEPQASMVYLRAFPQCGFYQLLSEPHGLFQLTWNEQQPLHHVVGSLLPTDYYADYPGLESVMTELREALTDDGRDFIRAENRR